MCDAVSRLPTTPVAAVRRALMTTARLVRTSALEIKAESAGASAEAADLPALVRGGLAALRCTQRLVELALSNVETAVTAASAEPPAAAAAAAAGAAAPAPAPAPAALTADLVAVADAAGALHDAVIDLAYVVNGGADGDDGDDLDEEDEGKEDEDEEAGEDKGTGAVAVGGESGGGGDGSELAEAVAAMASAADSLVAALSGSCAPAPADAAALGEALAAAKAAVGALR
jgi:hypothetical protein